jgi:WXG100 family type VII secretion target
MVDVNGGFTEDTAQLRKAADDIYECFTDLASEVSTLTMRLEPLKSQWAGTAAAAFAEVWAHWEADMQKIGAALMGMGDKVGQASNRYHQAEATELQSISKVMQALG